VIKWTDFALLDDLGPILEVSDVVYRNDINHDLKVGVVLLDAKQGSIRIDAGNGMRIQETGSKNKPARMVGPDGSDDRKLFPNGRMPHSLLRRGTNDIGTGGGE